MFDLCSIILLLPRGFKTLCSSFIQIIVSSVLHISLSVLFSTLLWVIPLLCFRLIWFASLSIEVNLISKFILKPLNQTLSACIWGSCFYLFILCSTWQLSDEGGPGRHGAFKLYWHEWSWWTFIILLDGSWPQHITQTPPCPGDQASQAPDSWPGWKRHSVDFEGPKLPWVFGALSSLLSLSGPQMWIINSLPHLDCYFTPFSALIILYLDCLGYFGSV